MRQCLDELHRQKMALTGTNSLPERIAYRDSLVGKVADEEQKVVT
jgi:hypothetical protein